MSTPRALKFLAEKAAKKAALHEAPRVGIIGDIVACRALVPTLRRGLLAVEALHVPPKDSSLRERLRAQDVQNALCAELDVERGLNRVALVDHDEIDIIYVASEQGRSASDAATAGESSRSAKETRSDRVIGGG